MKWKKNISTLLSFFLISSLILVSFGYAINPAQNDVNKQSNGLADSPWPRSRGNKQGTGLSPYNTSFVDGTEKWNITVNGNINSQPIIAEDGTVYLCTDKGTIYAIRNKKKIWNVSLGADLTFPNTPALGSDGTLYFTTFNGNLTAVSPEGRIKWTTNIEQSLKSTPVIGEEGTIYVSSFYNSLYGIYPNGTVRWKISSQSVTTPVDDASPVIGKDGSIYFGVGDNTYGSIFYSADKKGKINWKIRPDGRILSSSPAVSKEGTIYFGSTNGNLYAVNTNGIIKWKFNTDSSIAFSSPGIDDRGNVYIGSFNGKLFSIDPSGVENWKVSLEKGIITSPAISKDGTIYVSNNGTLCSFNSHGKEMWNFSTKNEVGVSPSIDSDGTVYFASGNKLYALGPSSPEVNIISPKQKEIYKNSVTVEWEGSIVGTDIEHYEVKIDEKSWIDIGKDSSYKFEDMKEGKHVFKVKAVAESGNYDIDSIEITVFTPPELNILAPKEDEIFNTSSVTVEWTSNDESGIDHHEVQLDDDNWIDVSQNIEYTFEDISDGEHTVRVIAVDNTGNSTEKSVNFTVDTTPPTADAGENIEVGISEQFTLDGTGSTDNTEIETYRWIINGEAYNKKVVDLSIDEIGEHTAKLTVTDIAGNNGTDTITVSVVDNVDPTADAGEDRTVKVDEEVTFDASSSSDNVGITSYEWDFDDGTAANGETVTHKFDEKGTYEVTLTVSDEAGNTDTDTVTVTVEKKDKTPGFTLMLVILGLSLALVYIHIRE